MSLPAGHGGVVLGAKLTLQELPGCAAIRLWLVDSATDLDACYRAAWSVEKTPMWAFCWGSGLALARYIFEHPEMVRGKTVVDFGCGSGVVAIAAALVGARAFAVDSDEEALAFASANAAENGVAVEAQAELPDEYDLLLASDVLYEREARDFILGLRSRGKPIVIADALRPGTIAPPEAPFAELASRAFPDVDPPMDRAYFYRLE
ncbi:MAG: 50S ribosomal protein L11 methyltransferase [Polyangiaceae bacterium]|nr:50S ribosomal protein L11 methyltransferase [Polyangiaceae bacterium]